MRLGELLLLYDQNHWRKLSTVDRRKIILSTSLHVTFTPSQSIYYFISPFTYRRHVFNPDHDEDMFYFYKVNSTPLQ